MKFCVATLLTITIIISIFSGCLSDSTDSSKKYSQDDIAYFQAIALGFEDSTLPDLVYKYNKSSIKIQVLEDPDPESWSCLNTTISDFNTISKYTKLSVVNDSNAEIKIYFVPKSDFPKYIKFFNKEDYAYFWDEPITRNCEILSGVIVISTDSPSEYRCHVIREELTQSLGLAKENYQYRDSMFYGHSSIYTTKYSEIDKHLIDMLYNSNIRSCATKDDVKNYFTDFVITET